MVPQFIRHSTPAKTTFRYMAKNGAGKKKKKQVSALLVKKKKTGGKASQAAKPASALASKKLAQQRRSDAPWAALQERQRGLTDREPTVRSQQLILQPATFDPCVRPRNQCPSLLVHPCL